MGLGGVGEPTAAARREKRRWSWGDKSSRVKGGEGAEPPGYEKFEGVGSDTMEYDRGKGRRKCLGLRIVGRRGGWRKCGVGTLIALVLIAGLVLGLVFGLRHRKSR